MWILWDLSFMYWMSLKQLVALSNVITSNDPDVFEKINFKVKMKTYRQINNVSLIVIFVICLINSTLSVLYIDLDMKSFEFFWIGSASCIFLIGLTIIILLVISLRAITQMSEGFTWKNPFIIHLTLGAILTILIDVGVTFGFSLYFSVTLHKKLE